MLLKIFNLELKDNDHMAITCYIRAIVHDIDAILNVKVEIFLIAFINVLYPTYSHYFELLQGSVQLNVLKFDTMVEKIA